MSTNYNNRKAFQSLQGEAVLVTLDAADAAEMWRLQEGQLATNQSSGKTGLVNKVNVYGNSFWVRPIKPNTTFESAGIYGYMANGEVVNVLTGTQLPIPPPGPDEMTIVLENIGSPITLGGQIDFGAYLDRTPDSTPILHLSVIGGGSQTFPMSDFGGGFWGFNGWTSYYDAPTWDVDQTLEYQVTALYNGVEYQSETLQSDGI